MSKNLFKVKGISYNKSMRKQYPSDIAREQFEHIRPLLEGARKKTAPRKVDLYEVFCAVLYCSKAAANGVCCLKFFPNGLPSIIILAYGIKPQAENVSRLHQCLKKERWRGPYKTWAEILQAKFFDSRHTEC